MVLEGGGGEGRRGGWGGMGGEERGPAQTEHQVEVEGAPLPLDVNVAVLELLVREDQTLLNWGDASSLVVWGDAFPPLPSPSLPSRC